VVGLGSQDSLRPPAVEPLLGGRFGHPYTYVESCESTQALLGPDAPEGAVAVADEQTAGRGRYGRAWRAPVATSLLCSVVLRPPGLEHAPQLTLVGGAAAAGAIEGAVGRAALIKWPNDVMLDGRKVAGVLGELRDRVVVLGIGINVNQELDELPADARVPAASLRSATGTTHDRAALLAALLDRLEQLYDAWRVGRLDAVFAEIEPRDFLRGRQVVVDGVRGVAAGVTRDGGLELATGDGMRVVVESGQVEYAR
jgi:BirA family biotin operon repressor/biotin-[acetyl-CoA-carboxylase] ligase